MVVDTSVVLAVLFEEGRAKWAEARLAEHAQALRMSTVNLAEALILIRDRRRSVADILEARLLAVGMRFIAPDVAQARTAAAARLRFPLNLGDCFAYALSVAEDCPILTMDEAFRKTDRPALLPPEGESVEA